MAAQSRLGQQLEEIAAALGEAKVLRAYFRLFEREDLLRELLG
ncbi:MAG: hypothetical protein ABI645_10710 [Pseudomonadota bacterium]